MRPILCELYDHESFFDTLIRDFVERTDGFAIKDIESHRKTDIILLDPEMTSRGIPENKDDTYVIIISNNKKYLQLLFDERIADFMYKPMLNYPRFYESMEKLRHLIVEPPKYSHQ